MDLNLKKRQKYTPITLFGSIIQVYVYCTQGYFRSALFLTFYTCERFRPVLNSPRHTLCIKEIIWDIGIHPVLIPPADNNGEKGENKTGG